MTKFKVGDRVEFIDGSYRQSLLGKKGTVYSVSAHTPSQDLVRVRFDNEPRAGEGFSGHRLKKIEAEIAVGDKVIIDFLGHTRHNHVGVLQSEFGSNGYIVNFGEVAGYYFDKKVIKRWLPPQGSAAAQEPTRSAQHYRALAEAAHSGAPAGMVAEALGAKSKATTTNPKDLFGAVKVSLTKLPAVGVLHGAHAMMDGAVKYGPYNWRDKKVIASIYVDAIQRHCQAWFEGQELATDSGVHHLGHAIACAALLLDAQETGNLVDDRPVCGDPTTADRVQQRLSETIKRRKAEKEANTQAQMVKA